MIEFWLTFNNGAEKLRLPVPPKTIEWNTGNNNTVININDIGEILLSGKSKLKSTTIATYFPIRDDGLCQYTGFPSPAECIDMVGRWRDSGRPMRLIITGVSFKVNESMLIENFIVSQRNGPEDIYFSLELKQYRFLNLDSNSSTSTDTLQEFIGETRESEREIPESYTIKSGDTLWAVAKRFYDDGSRWSEIKANNEIVDEGSLVIGTVIQL